MRPVAALLALLLVATPLQAQKHKPAAKPPEPPPPPPTGSITGTVFCADTHRPARGATIFIEPLASVSGDDDSTPIMNSISRTGSDGAYSVQHVHPGDYLVLAIFPGYLSSLQEVQSLSALRGAKDTEAKQRERLSIFPSITVDPGKTTTYDITVERGAAVSGRILYSDGSPAAQVPVQLEHADPEASAKSQDDLPKAFGEAAFTSQSLSTDDLGHFRIASIKPGTYRVAAVQADSGPKDYTDMAYVTYGDRHPTAILIYSGDTIHKADAKTYDLRAGEEVMGVDITIALDAFHHVRGTLTSKDGRTITSAQLTLKDDGDDPKTFKGSLLTDGTFDFPNIPPGTYTLQATEAAIQIPDPDEQSSRFVRMKTTHAFDDGSTTLIVKDADLLDVSLTLREVPLKEAAKQADKDEDDKE